MTIPSAAQLRILVCMTLAAAFVALRAQPSGEFSDKKLELPTLTVTEQRDLPPPESWRYARIDGFEVLSDASARETGRVLKDFQKFRQMLALAWPRPAAPTAASTLILCAGSRPLADFRPPGEAGDTSEISLLLRDRELASIVLDLRTTVINPADAPLLDAGDFGTVQARQTVDAGRRLHREFVRLHLAQSGAALPPWLVEGFTQIVMDIEYTDRWIVIGKIDEKKGAPVRAISGVDQEEFGPEYEVGDQPFNAALHRRALLPLDRFLAVAATDQAARNPLGNSLWAKQAYAFVHLCLFRKDGKFEQPLFRFLQRLQNEPLSEPLFQECFGVTYREMQGELRDYIQFTHHKFRTIRLDELDRITAVAPDIREATQGEVGRIKGDAQRLAGRPAEALATYRVAFARGERDPDLLAAFGTEELRAGQTERARKLLEEAVKTGAKRPSAYHGLARLRLDEAIAQSAVTGGKLSEAQIMAVFAPLIQARALPPACPETYELMAETWLRSPRPPPAANVQVLGEGVLKFPTHSKLTLHAAVLHARAGEREDAEALGQLGLRMAADDDTRRLFKALLAQLPPVQVAPATPGPKSAGDGRR